MDGGEKEPPPTGKDLRFNQCQGGAIIYGSWLGGERKGQNKLWEKNRNKK